MKNEEKNHHERICEEIARTKAQLQNAKPRNDHNICQGTNPRFQRVSTNAHTDGRTQYHIEMQIAEIHFFKTANEQKLIKKNRQKTVLSNSA